jgi:hypothetical protein
VRKKIPGKEAVKETLADFESGLDLLKPEGRHHGTRVLDYGELTVVLVLSTLPGRAVKRVSGFADETEASQYAESVRRYIGLLEGRGIPVVETDVFSVTGKTSVVYLVQPLLDRGRIGNSLLHSASTDELSGIIERILDRIASSLRANEQDPDGLEVTADAQISNWYFPEDGTSPLLLDVGTPVMRVGGEIKASSGFIYRSFPQPIRWVLERIQIVEDYYRDYFDLRLNITDMLGNFVKEKAAHRLPEGVKIVNRWLDRQPEGRHVDPFTLEEIERYYKSDAFLLELSLKARRVTRFIQVRLLRRRYDYILPGKIERR